MMQTLLLFGRGSLIGPVANLWMKRDRTYPGHTFLVLRHHAHRLVVVAVHLETLFGRQVKKRQHMATRNGRDKCFLWINVRRIRVRHRYDRWRWRGCHGHAAI